MEDLVTGATAEVELVVDLPVAEVWGLITDVSRTSEWSPEYLFEGPDGEQATLLDLFEGRSQLLVCCFMWHGAGDFCSGCLMFTDNIGHLAHVHVRDTSFALVSRGPQSEIKPYKDRMGWTMPWFSALDDDFNDFNDDMGAGEGFALNAFLRDGDDVYRTYVTSGRGVERLGSGWTFLDLTPLGRQETWGESPEGRPQSEPYQWWRLHDEYAEHGA